MGLAVGKDIRGLNFIGHGGGIAGFTSEAVWYPDARAAIVVLFNCNCAIDPGAVAGELAAELLPWTRPGPPKAFAGDAAPFAGTYKGPSRGREMSMVITVTPQGLMASPNGAPARPLSWEDGTTFRQGNSFFTFRRSGNDGPVTELRFNGGPSAYYILKRQ
jgi:hypothetical protein